MSDVIENLLSKYEHGRMTRRELVATLTTLAVAPRARLVAQGAPTPVPIRSLNHVSIEVKDVERSVEFYQRVFGLKVKSREGTPGNPIAGGATGISVVNLATGAGPEFIGIYNGATGANGSINHFCLGVQNYDPDRTLKTLTDQGVRARMRTRGESKEIFVTDPDNISVQLTDVSYCGGSGPFGNKC